MKPIVLMLLMLFACSTTAEHSKYYLYYLAGQEAVKEGLCREAIFNFKKAISLEPNSPALWNNLGVALEACGYVEEALEAYKKAGELATKDKLKRMIEENIKGATSVAKAKGAKQ